MKKMTTLLAGVLAVAAFGAVAQAETRLAVQDATGTTDRMVVTDTGAIGIGTNAPTASLQVFGNMNPTLSGIHIIGTNFPNNTIKIEGLTNSGGLTTYLTKPGTALPTSGERLGFIYFGTMNNGTTPATPMHTAGIKANADEAMTPTAAGTSFSFETTPVGSVARYERMRISSSGNVGIGTTTPTSKLQVVGLPVYANNAAAKAGGLTAGAFYRTGGDPDLLCVVH